MTIEEVQNLKRETELIIRDELRKFVLATKLNVTHIKLLTAYQDSRVSPYIADVSLEVKV